MLKNNTFQIILLSGCILIVIALLYPASFAQEPEDQIKYEYVFPGAGENCIICGVALTENDVVLIVRGRRIPLNRSMVDSFMNNQVFFFNKVQPKGALFQENFEAPAGVAQGGINLSWFLFGLYVLLGLIFGGLSGYHAISKGLSPLPNFFFGFVFSVFGYIYVRTKPAFVNKEDIPKGLVKVPSTNSPVQCSSCKQTNHPSACHCSECGAELKPLYESEVTKTK